MAGGQSNVAVVVSKMLEVRIWRGDPAGAPESSGRGEAEWCILRTARLRRKAKGKGSGFVAAREEFHGWQYRDSLCLGWSTVRIRVKARGGSGS